MAIPSLAARGALVARSMARAALATSFRRAVAAATAASAASSALQAYVGRWKAQEQPNKKPDGGSGDDLVRCYVKKKKKGR